MEFSISIQISSPKKEVNCSYSSPISLLFLYGYRSLFIPGTNPAWGPESFVHTPMVPHPNTLTQIWLEWPGNQEDTLGISLSLARELTNRFFPVSNFCEFPLSGGFSDQFFPSCQGHVLSSLGSAPVRPSYSWPISSLVGAHTSLRDRVCGKAPAQGGCWFTWVLGREHRGREGSYHPTSSSTSPRRWGPNKRRLDMRSGGQSGHAAETFNNIFLNYSGMPAKAWANLSCVTGKRIARLLKR